MGKLEHMLSERLLRGRLKQLYLCCSCTKQSNLLLYCIYYSEPLLSFLTHAYVNILRSTARKAMLLVLETHDSVPEPDLESRL